MVRVRRTSDASHIRIFRTESGSGLARLANIGFGNEDQLHKLIEGNIGNLFPGLTFLGREFRQLDGGRHIPDTVAFDGNQNTFAVIEYKNKLDRGVIDQVKAYLKRVKKNKHALVMEYIKSEGDGLMELESYNWDVYAIIMAPEFSPNQLDSAEDDGSLELYEIKRYDADILTVRRMGGGHERALTEAAAPGPVAKAPQTQAAARTSSLVSSATKTDRLYDGIRAGLLGAFSGAEETATKYYNGFRRSGGNYFCTVIPQKSKMWLYYSGKRAASELKPDGFVLASPNRKWGSYRSEIRNEDDFEKALAILKGLHAGGSGGAPRPAPPSARRANGKRMFPDELLKRALQLPRDHVFYTAAIILRPPIAEGDRTILTFGGLDTKNRVRISQQVVIPDSFPQIAAIVKQIQDDMMQAGSGMRVTVIAGTTGNGLSLWDFLRDSGMRDSRVFEGTKREMYAAYVNLWTELAEGRVFLQDADSSNMDELCEQLRGIIRMDDGLIEETKGSDRATSLAIAVRDAKRSLA